jgi:hypothetical protein
MADLGPIADQLEVSAERLVDGSEDDWVSGDDVARAIDMNPEDGDVYGAFRVIQKRGRLRVEVWPEGKGLPLRVSR